MLAVLVVIALELFLLLVLLALVVVRILRLPAVFTSAAEVFADNARRTPGFRDDVLGAGLIFLAHGFSAAMGKKLPTETLPAETRAPTVPPTTAGSIVARKIDLETPGKP
jgi:hypothetical protein